MLWLLPLGFVRTALLGVSWVAVCPEHDYRYAKNTFNYLMCLETSTPRAHWLLMAFAMYSRSRFHVHKNVWHATVRAFLFLFFSMPGVSFCVGISESFLAFPKQLRPGPQSAVSSLTAGCLRRNTWVCSCQCVSLLQPPSWETAEVRKIKCTKLPWFCCQQRKDFEPSYPGTKKLQTMAG